MENSIASPLLLKSDTILKVFYLNTQLSCEFYNMMFLYRVTDAHFSLEQLFISS